MTTPHLVDAAHATLDAIVAIYDDRLDGRWPLLRTGTRDKIPAITRHLVLARDNDRCKLCDFDYGLELDHLIPWSANGSDWSDNLRALCESCNGDRSNFREAYLPRVLPVTVVCTPCMNDHDSEDVADKHAFTTYWRYCHKCCPGPTPSGRRGTDGRISVWCGTCTAPSWCDDWSRIR